MSKFSDQETDSDNTSHCDIILLDEYQNYILHAKSKQESEVE